MSRNYNERKHFEKKWVKKRYRLIRHSDWCIDKKMLKRIKDHSPYSCVPKCPICMSPRHNMTISNKKWKYTIQELKSDINYFEWMDEYID